MTATPLASFLQLRANLVSAPIGDGGPDTCEALVDSLDTALLDLAADVTTGATVVALGGYGRREQCLWSDVDVMLLYDGADKDALVRSILYPLWDANLKVGHAVRTVAECREAGSEQFDTLTSLLSARLVAGDESLFQELLEAVTDMVRFRPLTPRLVARERERRDREPYPTMAADVKAGRGALRTHQGFWWERRRAELIGVTPDQQEPDEQAARAALLRTRNALHAGAGRAADRFVIDLRQPAARWLGMNVHSMSAALTSALDVGDRLADRRWPDLHAEQDPLVGFGRRIFGRIRHRFSTPDESEPTGGTVLTTAVAAAGRREGARFTPPEEDRIRDVREITWTPADRAAFTKLLSAGARGRTVFGRLVELGWTDRAFPEWSAVATAPQLAPFHDHPVGAHLWRATDEMQAMISSSGEPAAIAERVGSTEELLLAAFLHDIGKARGGNHDIVGAELTAAFLTRAGFGPATVGVVRDVVRHHLLLSQTATRRDITDRSVIEEVADQVGTTRKLDILYLLTIADLRATGTTMWNHWREALLRRLYRQLRETLETGTAPRATANVDMILEAAGEHLEQRSVEEHVAAMPDDYLDTATPREIAWHMEIASQLTGPALVVVDPIDAGRVLVAGRDRTGFLLAVTRALTATGVEVMDARLRTRADGIALDTFHVRDDRTGEAVSAERWHRVSQALLTSLEDGADIRPAIRQRVQAYRPRDHDPRRLEVRAYRTGRFTAIEVRTADRVGLLADVVEALYGEGLDVHFAIIDTVGREARDIFHVSRGGVPVHGVSELEALRRRLEDTLRR